MVMIDERILKPCQLNGVPEGNLFRAPLFYFLCFAFRSWHFFEAVVVVVAAAAQCDFEYRRCLRFK